jgi:cell division septation protein DedD
MDGAGGAEAPGWLPETARRLLLVGSSAGDGWRGAAALEVAEAVARQRPRTLLVNAVVGAAGPDDALESGGVGGLGEVLAGRSRVSEVAFTPPGRSFIAVPAGGSVPGFVELCRIPAFRHLVSAAGRGGTLLLHITETDLSHLTREPVVAEGLGLDGLVMLGAASIPRNLPPGLQVLARVEPGPPGTPAGRPESVRGRTPGFAKPSRTPAIVAGGGARKRPRGRLERWADELRRRRAPRGVGGVAVVWLVAVFAVWLVWQGLSGWPAFEDDLHSPIDATVAESSRDEGAAESEGAAEPEGPAVDNASEAVEPTAPTAAGEAAPQGVADTERVPEETGVELPYSILVASVPTYADAAAKRDELERDGNLSFIAPTLVSGGLYYRVFAGALEDREQARELMRRLVAGGQKERERDWDMRPASLAFTLGDFSSGEEAEAERQRLQEAGVPTYVLSVGDSAGALHRLYFGAFESERAAGPADSILTAAGRTATLMTRRGEPR